MQEKVMSMTRDTSMEMEMECLIIENENLGFVFSIILKCGPKK